MQGFGLHPGWQMRSIGVFLKKTSIFNTIWLAAHGDGPVLEIRQNPTGHITIIINELALAYTFLFPVKLVQMAYFYLFFAVGQYLVIRQLFIGCCHNNVLFVFVLTQAFVN